MNQRMMLLNWLAFLPFVSLSVLALPPPTAVGASPDRCQRVAWFSAIGELDGKAGKSHHDMLLVALQSWKRNAASLEAHILYGGKMATVAFAADMTLL